MTRPTKDLFDDTAMTFGEHLEVLRIHLIKALIGLVIAVVFCLFQGSTVIGFVRKPIDDALRRYSEIEIDDDTEQMMSFSDRLYDQWGLDVLFGARNKSTDGEETETVEPSVESVPRQDAVRIRIPVDELRAALHKADPETFPAPQPSAPPAEPKATNPAPEKPPAGDDNGPDKPATETPGPDATPAEEPAPPVEPGPSPTVSLTIRAPEFAQFQATVEQSRRAVTLNVQEAFVTYLKVSLIAGAILSSPWIFFQLWLFVASGLYPHERKYVYVYGTISLVLFLVGALFCFYAVFPFVLKFLLSFNSALEIHPQIRLSEWISFAITLPLMFGVSFQLPLVMLFLERISIFSVTDYRERRRMAILVIATLSMFLTPADPMSMLLMMFPLIFLYELGIVLCGYAPAASPFESEAA